jgi:hypothetical protein
MEHRADEYEAVVRAKKFRNEPDAKAQTWRSGAYSTIDRASAELVRLIASASVNGYVLLDATLHPSSQRRQFGDVAVVADQYGHGWFVTDDRGNTIKDSVRSTFGEAQTIAASAAKDAADLSADRWAERYADPDYIASLTEGAYYEPPYEPDLCDYARDPLPEGIECAWKGTVADCYLERSDDPDDLIVRDRAAYCDEGDLVDHLTAQWIRVPVDEGDEDGHGQTSERATCPRCKGVGYVSYRRADELDGEAAAQAVSTNSDGEQVFWDTASPMQFRVLDDDEENLSREWARANYVIGTEIKLLWNPVVRAECALMNAEAVLTGQPS